MAATIMDGRVLSGILRPHMAAHVRDLVAARGSMPELAAIVVGDDPASARYVANKRRMAAELGIGVRMITLAAPDANTAYLLDTIDKLNRDPRVNGILLQLPLPEGVDTAGLFDAIDPLKDVDAVGASAVTGFYRGRDEPFIPCTPRGVLELLRHHGVPVAGRRAVVIGRGDIAGKPMALILGGRLHNATVTWCHRHTGDLRQICLEADILVSCAGSVPGCEQYLITADMVKPGACVIDVGLRRLGPKRFVGDVDFNEVQNVAGWITPTPGGTGPMTVTALMQNLIDAARYQLGLQRAEYHI